MKSNSYAQCREEDVGNSFFIIFLFYFLINIIVEIFKNTFNCCRKNKENFIPVKSIINFFTTFILYLIAMFYIPFLCVIFPFIVIAIYKKRNIYFY